MPVASVAHNADLVAYLLGWVLDMYSSKAQILLCIMRKS